VPTSKEGSKDFDELRKNSQDRNIGIEIDVSDPKKLSTATGIHKIDCFPIFWAY